MLGTTEQPGQKSPVGARRTVVAFGRRSVEPSAPAYFFEFQRGEGSITHVPPGQGLVGQMQGSRSVHRDNDPAESRFGGVENQKFFSGRENLQSCSVALRQC